MSETICKLNSELHSDSPARHSAKNLTLPLCHCFFNATLYQKSRGLQSQSTKSIKNYLGSCIYIWGALTDILTDVSVDVH